MCYSYFLVDSAGMVVASQEGVFRSNCMDCLDRTNVIQSLLARRSLQAQLQVQSLFPPPGPAARPTVEKLHL